ncbi:MAG: hypothetical protein P8M80_01405 [Pirellulaceae bacterium]|nr:hypothetical protein [Pirellulaceae bacterium]
MKNLDPLYRKHLQIFQDATTKAHFPRDWHACIVLRQPNQASVPYIELACKGGQYKAKRSECKAKTADLGPHAGLVVNPEALPHCFSENRIDDAVDSWKDFLRGEYKKDKGWTVIDEPAHEHHGCLTHNGSRIFGDYDLFDIIPWNPNAQETRRRLGNVALVTVTNRQDFDEGKDDKLKYNYTGWGHDQLAKYINMRVGIKVILHGAERPFNNKYRSGDKYDIFTPRSFASTPVKSRSADRGELKNFYRSHFPMRDFLKLSARTK